MFKKKENIIIIVVLLIMVIAIIGVSYAAFSYSGLGTKVNSITTGSITMEYTEDDNIISMSGALPTTDATGKVRLNPGEYFDFTVSSKIAGDVNINYEISAKDVTTSERKIDGSNIKLYLTRLTDDGEEELMTPETYNEETSENTYTGRPSGEMSLYTSSMNSSETNRYRLRMYVTEEYNPQGDGGGLTFSVRINVYGKDGDKMPVNGPASSVVLENLTSGDTFDDGTDTFITGTDPNNYIWYSGKLWRAVSVNKEAKTTKLVTQWNISTSAYVKKDDYATFEGSIIKEWLNDTTVDGFLYNLRDYDKFIVEDYEWYYNKKTSSSSVASIVPVGLLNEYEYETSYTGTTYNNGYLNNGLEWWTLTASRDWDSMAIKVDEKGDSSSWYVASSYEGIRPSINLKSSVKIVDGDGTVDNPYRLNGDNDSNLRGTLLSSRYSGEYVRFGTDENNLYRIVSHENGTGTKIVSAEPLKSSGEFITMNFGSNATFSSTNTIGTFLNGEYLTSYVDSSYSSMIEDNTTWYLGTVGSGSSYKLAKYTDANMTGYTTSTNAKVGLLRMGELMAGQFDRYGNNTNYWTLTPYSSSRVRFVRNDGYAYYYSPSGDSDGVRPSVNLKSNVQIINGDGTLNSPFEIQLGS